MLFTTEDTEDTEAQKGKGSPDLDPEPFHSHPSLCSLCPLWLKIQKLLGFQPVRRSRQYLRNQGVLRVSSLPPLRRLYPCVVELSTSLSPF